MRMSFWTSLSSILRDRNAGPLRDNAGDVLFVHLLLEHAFALLHLLDARVRFLQLALEILSFPVPQLGNLGVIPFSFRLLLFDMNGFDLFLDGTNGLDQFFLALPAQLHLRRLFAKLTELLSQSR